jgi:hypothetical protein
LFEAVGHWQNGKLNMEIKVTIFTTDILYKCLRTKENLENVTGRSSKDKKVNSYLGFTTHVTAVTSHNIK